MKIKTFLLIIILISIISFLKIYFTPCLECLVLGSYEQELKKQMTGVRNAINIYYHQHPDQKGGVGSRFPGGNALDGNPAAQEKRFFEHLCYYTNSAGDTSSSLDRSRYPYGPILKTGIPDNAFPSKYTKKDDVDAIEVVQDGKKLKATKHATKGWKYDVKTGEFIVNNPKYESW